MPGQKPIISLMKPLNYKTSEKGMCWGIALLAIQAWISNDFQSFKRRIYLIQELGKQPKEVFLKELEEAEILSTLHTEALKKTLESEHGIPSTLEDYLKFNQLLDKELLEILTQRQSDLLSIKKFFDGVSIHSVGKDIEGLGLENLTQNADRTLPFTLPLSLLNRVVLTDAKTKKQYISEESNVAKIKFGKDDSFSGMYNRTDLIKYLNVFSQELKQLSFDTKPIALSLNSGNHSIALGYDFKTSSWTLIDPNYMPCSAINDSADFATQLQTGFFEPADTIPFTSSIYTTKDQTEKIQQCIDKCMQHENMKEINKITKEKCNKKDLYGFSLLYLAVCAGQTETVKEILTCLKNENKSYFSFFSTDTVNSLYGDNHGSLLYHAVQTGNIDIVKALLDYGVDPTICDCNGVSPLLLACTLNQVAMAKMLINHSTINLKTKDSCTPLFMAAQNGQANLVLELLLQGANPNICDVNGASPLYIAAQGGHIDVVEELILSKADLNTTFNSISPLCIAIINNHFEIAEMLIRNGANLELSDKKSGMNALHLATLRDLPEIVKLLIVHGADLTKKTNTGYTANDIASLKKNANLINVLSSKVTSPVKTNLNNFFITKQPVNDSNYPKEKDDVNNNNIINFKSTK